MRTTITTMIPITTDTPIPFCDLRCPHAGILGQLVCARFCIGTSSGYLNLKVS